MERFNDYDDFSDVEFLDAINELEEYDMDINTFENDDILELESVK